MEQLIHLIPGALPYPNIDPIAVQFGPLAIRWYSLAYIIGLVGGMGLLSKIAKREDSVITEEQAWDFLSWACMGVILGGRVGYCLFYKPEYYLFNPLEILAVWKGGMSFHGGVIGSTLVIYLYARHVKVPFLALADMVSSICCIGLFLGRVANFVNGELYGRVTDVAWAFVFPHGGPLPRHPSQLYEGILEGVILFAILNLMRFTPAGLRRHGRMAGTFMVGYALSRFIVEFFREPDAHLGILQTGTTMGQNLSIPMVFLGIYWIVRAYRRPLADLPVREVPKATPNPSKKSGKKKKRKKR
ncbi:MAG: prolipoprotein diacylglyceryl transferase [Deltaproteobacteria bacterium]|nr:prolipoprotein diacylglyceryl transferase [Deltaproteobacteria bacterium]